MTKYKHPELILHIPDFYGPWDGRMHKWKDRFSTSVTTAATSLIRYLEWPGDKRRSDYRDGVMMPFPDATELGPFAIYRIDEEATAKLHAEMSRMDPAGRSKEVQRTYGGSFSYPVRTTDKAFSAKLREAITRALE